MREATTARCARIAAPRRPSATSATLYHQPSDGWWCRVAEAAEARRGAAIRAHRAVVASRIAAQLQYRTSFAFDLAQSVVGTAAGRGEVAVGFTNVPVLADLDLRAAVLVYALATVGVGLANAVVGQLDTIPDFIRS